MKKFKISTMILAATAFAATTFTACTQEEELQPNNDTVEINDKVLNQFTDLGFDVSDIDVVTGYGLEGGNEKSYLLEGDIVITKDNFEKMLESGVAHEGPVGEQYRTYNLVSAPQTINVIGYTANNSQGLDSKMQTALGWAVANYNRLNTNLNFTLTYGTNYSSYDIVVYRVSGGGGGSAGFPSGGAPYKWVQIHSGTSNYDTNVVEHVMTHEIGHAVGLRHTDYFNRSLSCGSGGNEGSGGVGAVHISGTPTGFDANSIMLSCFSSSESGEFGNYDVVALENLY